MSLTSPVRSRLALRPRAGLAATALLIAGLAGSGAVALFGDFVEPARAQSAAGRIDQPTPATIPNTDDRRHGGVAPAGALKPSTDVMTTASTGGERVDSKARLPDSTR